MLDWDSFVKFKVESSLWLQKYGGVSQDSVYRTVTSSGVVVYNAKEWMLLYIYVTLKKMGPSWLQQLFMECARFDPTAKRIGLCCVRVFLSRFSEGELREMIIRDNITLFGSGPVHIKRCHGSKIRFLALYKRYVNAAYEHSNYLRKQVVMRRITRLQGHNFVPPDVVRKRLTTGRLQLGVPFSLYYNPTNRSSFTVDTSYPGSNDQYMFQLYKNCWDRKYTTDYVLYSDEEYKAYVIKLADKFMEEHIAFGVPYDQFNGIDGWVKKTLPLSHFTWGEMIVLAESLYLSIPTKFSRIANLMSISKNRYSNVAFNGGYLRICVGNPFDWVDRSIFAPSSFYHLGDEQALAVGDLWFRKGMEIFDDDAGVLDNQAFRWFLLNYCVERDADLTDRKSVV